MKMNKEISLNFIVGLVAVGATSVLCAGGWPKPGRIREERAASTAKRNGPDRGSSSD